MAINAWSCGLPLYTTCHIPHTMSCGMQQWHNYVNECCFVGTMRAMYV